MLLQLCFTATLEKLIDIAKLETITLYESFVQLYFEYIFIPRQFLSFFTHTEGKSKFAWLFTVFKGQQIGETQTVSLA